MDLIIRHLSKADRLGSAVTRSDVMVSYDRMNEAVSDVYFHLYQCAHIWIGETGDEDRPVIFEGSRRVLDKINWTNHDENRIESQSVTDTVRQGTVSSGNARRVLSFEWCGVPLCQKVLYF